MNPRPLRLPPGTDLRRELERLARESSAYCGFIIAGIGSIGPATLRYAGIETESVLPGPHEVLVLSGSLSKTGAHLHITVANSAGQVFGGHLCDGNIVRTTAELLLMETPGWLLSREIDRGTGYKELVVTQSVPRVGGAASEETRPD
jgi:uncharacterized protein